MSKQEYFTKDEIVDIMKNAQDYSAYDSVYDFCDLFDEMFHRDYYIRGAHEASEALDTYTNDKELDGYKIALKGKTGATVLVVRYELDQFGSLLTSRYDEPEELATMVEYIRGNTLFKEALNRANLSVFDKTTEKNLQKFIEVAKRL